MVRRSLEQQFLNFENEIRVVRWADYFGTEWWRLRWVSSKAVGSRVMGVYIVWLPACGERLGRVLYVGQGQILDRLQWHRRQDSAVVAAAAEGARDLLVTWAEVKPKDLNGVERYVAMVFRPTVGKEWPDAFPIKVNLPELYR